MSISTTGFSGNPSFDNKLSYGTIAEDSLADFFTSQGYEVIPASTYGSKPFEGPRVPGTELRSPDLLLKKDGASVWVEVKRKTGFTDSRKYKTAQTGIDIHLYEDYIAIKEATGLPVWIVFIQESGQAKDSTSTPPGIYYQEIDKLRANESHRWDSGTVHMVYFNKSAFKYKPIEILDKDNN